MLQNTTQCIPVHFTILQGEKKKDKRKEESLPWQETDVRSTLIGQPQHPFSLQWGTCYTTPYIGPVVWHKAPVCKQQHLHDQMYNRQKQDLFWLRWSTGISYWHNPATLLKLHLYPFLSVDEPNMINGTALKIMPYFSKNHLNICVDMLSNPILSRQG